MITDCLLKKDPFLSDSIVGWGLLGALHGVYLVYFAIMSKH